MEAESMLSVSTYDRAKRAAEILVAGSALAALSPVILGTAMLVRMKLGSPVLFRQERPGRHGRSFQIVKFRSMLERDPLRGRVTNEERMTPFGERLRATSLDELPGLLNVLRGEMSLIGPRPLRTAYLERYSQEQSLRHAVRPGLTGLAQISGRNSLSWDERLELDVEYVRTRSLGTDLRILLATVPKVLRREGIAEEGQATMSEFFGPRRIGEHLIRPAVGQEAGSMWEVVDVTTNAVVARCELEGGGDERREAAIRIAAAAESPHLVRARASEMLRGVARELEDADRESATLPRIPERADR